MAGINALHSGIGACVGFRKKNNVHCVPMHGAIMNGSRRMRMTSKASPLAAKGVAVGIDLGTTNSVIAVSCNMGVLRVS